jgi:predicted nucleotidyltransferase
MRYILTLKEVFMLTEKQLELFRVFKKDLFRELSFNELKKELCEKSSSKLQRAIEAFKKKGLIKIKKIGRTGLISLNFENNNLFDYLSLFNFKERLPFGLLYKIQNEILKETEFFSLVVFGSYSIGKQRKDSDLDIAIIVDNEKIKKRVSVLIVSIKRREINKIHELIFTRRNFLDMLQDGEENVGKEIARKHFAFYGAINFYKLILKDEKWRN